MLFTFQAFPGEEAIVSFYRGVMNQVLRIVFIALISYGFGMFGAHPEIRAAVERTFGGRFQVKVF